MMENEHLSMDDRFLLKLKGHILNRLQDEDFSVEDLANEVAFSRSHLYRKIHALTGLSISQFIRNIRLEASTELLEMEVATVSEIAYRVGFGSSTYFTKCFHEYYGYPPGEHKRKSAEGNYTTPNPNLNAATNGSGGGTLESLHPRASGSLIEEIFRALIPYKPSLEKFLLVDEEEGESIDFRLLAYQSIKCFPWPLGVELRRLYSSHFKELDEARLAQSHKTFKKALRLMCYILIAELIEQIKNGSNPKSGQGQKLAAAIEGMKPSDIKFLLSEIPALINPDQCLIQGLNDLFDPAFQREVESWEELHAEKPNGKEAVYEACLAMEQSLIYILKKIAFLAKYRLVNVSDIRVSKPKFGEAQFEHYYHFLNAMDADFKLHLENLDAFADSHSVLLMNSIKDHSNFLNLSPFVVDTYEQNSDAKQNAAKRDIFLYHHWEKGELFYQGSDLNSVEMLTNYDQYPNWLVAFQKSLALIQKI